MKSSKSFFLMGLLCVLVFSSTVLPQSQPGYIPPGSATEEQPDIPGSASTAVIQPQCPPFYTFIGEGAEDQFGIPVHSAGDVNGDGFDDIIIGALFNDAGGTNAGRAYVFSGRTGDTLYVFTGEAAGTCSVLRQHRPVM